MIIKLFVLREKGGGMKGKVRIIKKSVIYNYSFALYIKKFHK